MAFIDDLGFVVALILAGAVVLTYSSIRTFWHILRNDPTRVRASIKASAVPDGLIGTVALSIGLWTEYTWPYLASDGLGSYNIFFGDVTCLFGMVMIVYAIVGYFGLKLEYAGLFGFVAGVITAWYGYGGTRPSHRRAPSGSQRTRSRPSFFTSRTRRREFSPCLQR